MAWGPSHAATAAPWFAAYCRIACIYGAIWHKPDGRILAACMLKKQTLVTDFSDAMQQAPNGGGIPAQTG